MPDNTLKKTLWETADKLRNSMDAAEYKHVVLGLIFLKHLSDSFDQQRQKVKEQLQNPESEEFLGTTDEEEILEELEDRDYYTQDNVYWVPKNARWEVLQENSKNPDFGKKIDDAMRAIENDNVKLKGILNKIYANLALSNQNLAELFVKIGEIQTVGNQKDLLGEVYEYFLGQFAINEGKRGGQYYTAQSVVKILVEILAPQKGKIYDPCCGSGGMFVQTMKFVDVHHSKDYKNISIYGQESNPTTWKLAQMNLAIRGLDFRLGKLAADSFHNDLHPDLRANFIMANPPFNTSDWGGEKLERDSRWRHGIPPVSNANYAWLQHILYHLASNGRAGVVLANGSMSTTSNNEYEIRKNMIEDDRIECILALPGQLFTNTQIPVCIWFLTKEKQRKNQVLFLDAREMGYMKERVLKDFKDSEIEHLGQVYQNWSNDKDYQDELGFCKSVSLQEIKEHDYILTPGRYVGVKPPEDDGIPFDEKMQDLTAKLKIQFQESNRLQAEIQTQLLKVGFEL